MVTNRDSKAGVSSGYLFNTERFNKRIGNLIPGKIPALSSNASFVQLLPHSAIVQDSRKGGRQSIAVGIGYQA
jgi:hypothetical protein